MSDSVFPVVVVGAGPAGLVAAITLARAGIQTLVLNSRKAVFSHPRATVVSLRSMELFRSWGLEKEIWAGGDEVEWRMLVTPTLSEAASGTLIDVGYPTRSESAVLSPTRPAAVPQDHVELVLLDYLRGLAAAHVELGVAVEDVWEAQTWLRVRLRDTGSGARRVVQARYVIGADGARSVVRQRLGVGASVTEDLLEALSVVIRAPLWEVVGLHRYGIYVTDLPGPGTFLPAGQGDRWAYGFSWDPRVERVADLREDQLIARIRAGAGVPDLPVRIVDQNRFTFSAAIADRFRSGNAFLIGDAAHRVTPRGGTGMNTAIADGFNLGWKLSWVLKDWAPEPLLDTYEMERRPIAEHNVARSIDPGGSRRSVSDELRFDLGGRLPHVWMDTADGRISSLDLLDPGLTRLSVDELSHNDDQSNPPPVTEHRLDPETAAALGADQPGGLLLRPDGVVWDPLLTAAADKVDHGRAA
ncbi:MAG TPA: FAD-dependent monooxygenase [Propionibacteriaceae bacterium]|nr:FAD-dependent monooxygenase [Propionibacteriaceae bacterium]